jgi:signal transduction histidine kinase/ActR/RegA family two-component response regulator
MLFEAAPTPYLVLSPAFIILAANDAFLEVAHRARASLMGRVVFEAFPDNPQDPAPTGVSNLRRSLEHVLRARCTDTMAVQQYDILLGTTPDAEAHFAERHWCPVNVPVLDPRGEVKYILHCVEEVSRLLGVRSDLVGQASTIASQTLEIESVQLRLRASELHALTFARQVEAERRRLNAVLEATPVGIFVTDGDGRLVTTNPANLELWGPRQAQVGELMDFKHCTGWWADDARRGETVRPHEWPMARALKGERIAGETIEILSSHDPPLTLTMLVSAAPVRDPSNRIIGTVTAVMDITDRVKAELSLRESDRRKDEFLAMLAHELRNPLAPIRAAADLLALAGGESERTRQTSAVIARQVRHLTAMVDDLLDVSRVTRALVKLESTVLDLRRVILDAVEQVRPLAEARQHRLEVRTPPAAVRVAGDAKRLVQVMTNLLNNAAKYTPSGGWIEVALGQEDSQAVITVKDNGIGMPPDLVDTAFELFAQAQRTSDRAQGGLGIGLALVKRLVELHGGQVVAHSGGVGHGSCFTVTLPLYTQACEVDAPAPASPEVAAPREALRVLVVDDNVDAAQMLALLVETLGHHPLVEHGPQQALARAAREHPDVCLLDIGLPGLDGYALAGQLRAQSGARRMTLVAVTGYGQDRDRERARRAGFDHHLVKPADTTVLARLLEQLAAEVVTV